MRVECQPPMPASLHTMMDYPLTLTTIVERAGRYFSNVEVVSRLPNRSIHRTTWRGIEERGRRLAESLHAAGLKKGDRVATLMWNHYAHLEAHFGVPAAGGVLHTLNLRLHPDEIAYIANHAQDRFLIVDDCLLPLLAKFRDQVRFERVIVVGDRGKVGADTAWDDFLALAPDDLAANLAAL